MHKFIKLINKNDLIIEIFENMDKTITNKGESWLVYNEYILNKNQIIKICDDRMSAMIKLLPGSIVFERDYLIPSIQYFDKFKHLVA